MVQGDSRNFSGPKRPRTDGPRNEGDWTCPSCGNVNFAFRTTCNMRNCSTSKPNDHSLKPMGAPHPTPYGQGPTLPEPLDCIMIMVHMLIQVGHMDLFICPPSYGHGAVIGPGPGYGAAPLLDGYGMGMPLGRGALGLRPGAVPDENGSRKRRGDGLSDGDWVCPKCGNTNFAFRTICNMRKCSTPKPTEHTAKSSSGAAKNSSKAPPEGSWTCEKCGNVNYPFRTKCNRANCGAEKPSDKNDSPKSDDDDQ